MEVTRIEAYARAFRALALGVTCPDEEFAAMVADGTMGSAMAQAAQTLRLPCGAPGAAQELGAARGNEATLGALRREYTRLFSAPGTAVVAPWESAFLDPLGERSEFGPQLVRTASSDDARRFYRAAGWDLAHHEAADSMRIELEFVARLLTGNGSEATDPAAVFSEFWDAHLSRWMVPFFEKVQRESRHSFYGDIGHFGKEVGEALARDVL